ncbi:MAG: hypothetical protein K9K36_16450 [Desulfarculaceae bacterium]|nr:hypothetical protein [Desulfarculaceae bacterium]MCF8049562.1 hypothetical protein [Desulfarculaceae bacterium]MCF8066841.1 hypothetical protein [Desulfarculaceae bacterium]
MPVYLKDSDNLQSLEQYGSVLIVPCRFCPAASLAVSRNQPYFEFLTNCMKTAAYESYLEEIKGSLTAMGVNADIFRGRLIHQFVICMWPKKRRRQLMKAAMNYDALLVMACEAGARTVCDAVESAPCKVYMGMRSEGIMSILPRWQKPGKIFIDLKSVIPLIHETTEADPWISL